MRRLGTEVVFGGAARQQYRNRMYGVFDAQCAPSFSGPFNQVFHGLYSSLKPGFIAASAALNETLCPSPTPSFTGTP